MTCQVCLTLADTEKKLATEKAQAERREKVEKLKELMTKKAEKGRFIVQALSKTNQTLVEYRKVADQVSPLQCCLTLALVDP